MERLSTVAIRTLAVLGLAVAIYLAATRPLSIDEADLWYRLIRPPLGDSWNAPNAWSGLMYAILAERFIGILHLSEFSLRLPALLSGAVCAWLAWRTRDFLFLIVYAVGVAAGWFSMAAGHGVALMLWSLALDKPRHAGWLFGLAVTASPPFAALGITWWRIYDIERVLIPAAAVAFVLLILPASHAGRSVPADMRPEFQRESMRRNAARGGGFQPVVPADK
jgi:hypothetical protein